MNKSLWDKGQGWFTEAKCNKKLEVDKKSTKMSKHTCLYFYLYYCDVGLDVFLK